MQIWGKKEAMWEQELGRNDGKITELGILKGEFEFCCSGSHLLIWSEDT